MNNEEKQRVVDHSMIANYGGGVMNNSTSYCCDLFKRFMIEGSVLELGPAEGIMTDKLAPFFKDYTVVDGADIFVNSILKRHQNVKGYALLFEEFNPDKKFDNIILGHVLEHVIDPVSILKRCSTWLSNRGRILVAVPNANSIHRQMGVEMGLLTSIYQLNETDCRNGHRRVYDIISLQKDFNDAGLKILKKGGYWLKPLSNSQIDSTWNSEIINASMIIGEKYPEIAAEIYIVASNE